MDTSNICYLLPVEVLRMICLQIKTPSDLKNLSNCSTFIRNLLLDLRVHFLAPEVFRNVFSRTTGKVLESCKDNSEVARLDTYLMKTDTKLKEEALHCRRVCSTWNKAVDECFEQRMMTANTAFDKDIYQKSGFFKPYSWNMQRFYFYFEPDKASQFTQAFNESHFILHRKNPFIGRVAHIEVTLDPVDEEVDFVLAIENVLRMFGTDIWYLVFHITSKRVSIGRNDYLKLCEYIGLLPNLRYLFIRFNTFHAHNVTEHFVSQNPLPRLEHLVILEVGDMNGPVLKEIVSKNNHVMYFGLHVQQNFDYNFINIFPNLKGFSATCVGETVDPIMNWLQRDYNFQILQLSQRCIDFDFSTNFQYLKTKFSDSLNDLTLELLFPVGQEQLVYNTKNLRLCLPKLRRLAINFSGIHFIDFICPLQNLEVLEIFLIPKEFAANYEFYEKLIKSEQIIEFVNFEKRMYDSNIWQHMKKLRKLKINFGDSCKCFEYTRKLHTTS